MFKLAKPKIDWTLFDDLYEEDIKNIDDVEQHLMLAEVDKHTAKQIAEAIK
jgi:hypothetical protein